MQYEAFVTATAVKMRRTMGDAKDMFARRCKAAHKSKLSEDTYVEATSGSAEVALGLNRAIRSVRATATIRQEKKEWKGQ